MDILLIVFFIVTAPIAFLGLLSLLGWLGVLVKKKQEEVDHD